MSGGTLACLIIKTKRHKETYHLVPTVMVRVVIQPELKCPLWTGGMTIGRPSVFLNVSVLMKENTETIAAFDMHTPPSLLCCNTSYPLSSMLTYL